MDPINEATFRRRKLAAIPDPFDLLSGENELDTEVPPYLSEI